MIVTINGKDANLTGLFHYSRLYCKDGLIEQLKAANLTGRINLRTEIEQGTGYKGGHETAAKMGWGIGFPAPKSGAVAFLEVERQGRFQGSNPETISFFVE